MAKTPELVKDVNKARGQVIKEISAHQGEEDTLFSKPIDIICFGRAGVGKTALLEALTGRDLGSTTALDHGTKSLVCIDVVDEIKKSNGMSVSINTRFWDTKGIEKWEGGEDVKDLFNEIQAMKVEPVCVFYCATSNGRVSSEAVGSILWMFVTRGVAVFYVITNIHGMSEVQLQGQEDGAKSVMRKASKGESGHKLDELVYQFGQKAFVVGVNSKKFSTRFVHHEPYNIDKLMQLCVHSLGEYQLMQFFLATLRNRSFWHRIQDDIKGITNFFSKIGIDIWNVIIGKSIVSVKKL